MARVRALIREHALEDRVSLLGDLDADALAAEYDRADLFVLPTLYEGYGMAVAEALARGVPVISTATGAMTTWCWRFGDAISAGSSCRPATRGVHDRADARARRRRICARG